MVQLTDEIISPVQIFLSEDDPDTPELDGFVSGGNISYKFWDASEQIEVININSTIFNGSEVFTPLGFSEVELQVNSILGCTEINSINYNPEATINDGTCILTIIGCMDIYACNFDPDANTEGDCLFFDCAQICDGSSYVDDCNVCDDDPLNDNECYGCMDQWALNYDPSSIIDSGSCDYPSIGDISMDGMINVTDIVLLVGVVLEGDIYIEYMDFNQDNYLNIIDIVILVDIILHPNTFGCIDLNAINYNPVAIYNDGSCEYECIDIDDNIYETVQVGDQFWMAENLKVTHYRNGDPIPTGYTNEEWSNLDDTDSGAFAIYDDDQGNVDIYGNLYNWYAVYESLGICPEGWQVPSDSEWSDLTNYLGSEAGGKLKETGFDHWNSPNTGATNESGFTALPGGYRNNGGYIHMGNYNYFWSTTAFNSSSSVGRKLYFNTSSVHQSHFDNRTGFSIRCIKDSQ